MAKFVEPSVKANDLDEGGVGNVSFMVSPSDYVVRLDVIPGKVAIAPTCSISPSVWILVVPMDFGRYRQGRVASRCEV